MNSLAIRYGSIQVFDDLLPPPLYSDLMQAASRIGWRFGWSTPSNPHSLYWHHEVARGRKSNTEDLSHNVRQHPLPVFAQYMDWLRENVVSGDTRILRFYLNAHTFGTDGWPHTDTDRLDELTTVLYLTETWKPEWCGETVVFDARGDIEAAVVPRTNRLLTFPSDRLHAPRPLAKAFAGLRIVLVIKMGAAGGDSTRFVR
jgi:SM-20-related protein